MAWFAAFEAERVRELADLGLRAVVGNFASGGPDLPLWSAFLPALDAAEKHAGWLGLQEHGAPWLWWLVGPHQPTGAAKPELRDEPLRLTGWTTLRHRLVIERALRPNGIESLPIIITSLRLDRGDVGDASYTAGPWTTLHDFWRGHDGAEDPIPYWRESDGEGARDPARYLAEQLAWYDNEIQRDPAVVGAAVGILGADERQAAYELAGTAASTWLVEHLRAARPFGSDGAITTAAHGLRLIPRGPEPTRLTRENLLDRRGFDEGWVEDFDLTQELAAPQGWTLRIVEGIATSAGVEALPAFGRPFSTLLSSVDVRPAERERLFGGAPYVWRLAARTPFHAALEQSVSGLVPGLCYCVAVRVVADPIVRDQPRVVYAPDQGASETRLSVFEGIDPSLPCDEGALATTTWQTGEALPFGRAGALTVAFTAPADAVTVRLEIRSRYALPLAAWHVQAPTLTPDAA
jgi:hypothetical protein